MALATNSGWKTGEPLAHPESGDEIVISGISGTFPESDSVVELRENLFNKVDLITCDSRRWDVNHPEIPKRSGKINNLNRFDSSFFGVHSKQAQIMDPMGRILLEKAYEAIFDAGVNPKDLRNTKTGVYIGTCNSESEKTSLYDRVQADGFGITGCSRAMLANRISYWLGVTGPSYALDTACSSSLYALEHAYRAIRDGHCDAAIVGGSNLCLHPFVSLQFYRLGILSDDGICKSFDNGANGYARSEAVVVILLQKAKDSRRVYTQIVHAKTNCDGYKPQGITYPAGKIQKLLLDDFYKECCIPPYSLEFVEAHGTGTRVGDPEELNTIDEIFCTGRSGPLLIGSIKSNLGHTEPVSGLCSIAKMIIAYETGYIAPNLHYSVPREGVPALINGKMKVITDKTQWNKGLSAVNSFGFGGANAHILLKKFGRDKVNNGIPTDDLPRLVCASGRTESAVEKIFDDLESKTVDIEQVGLLHAFYNQHIPGHTARGYTLLGSNQTKTVRLSRDTQYFSGERRPVWFVYSGMGSQWAGMGMQLMRIPVFAAAIEKCHKTLEPKGVDLKKIITDPDPNVFNNIINAFVGIPAIQIGLTDILKTIGIEPDYLIGHSVGELGCAYADGGLTAEQMILSAYCRGVASIECKPIKGSMAAVGLGYNQIKSMCPPEIEVACHNGPDSCTLSGPAEAMSSFVATLTSKGIFAKEVPSSNIAFHSRYISEAGPIILKSMKEIIPTPKSRSDRWVSTSIPESRWDEAKSKLCSAEYHTNNVLSPVLFEEASRLIQHNAITIEVAPHGLLQAILRRSLKKEAIKVALTKRGDKDNVNVLLNAIGNLYQYGLNPNLANIYPKVEFPVSVGTPMMSHLVEWDHSEDWMVATFKGEEEMTSSERTVNFSLHHEDNQYMAGHVVNGRNLYPATGYLVMVWETLGLIIGKPFTDLPVVFENVRLQRATNIPKNVDLTFDIVIQQGSGNFEIIENGAVIVTGKIYLKKDQGQDYRALPPVSENTDPNAKQLLTKDFYKELKLRGYQYSGLFRGVKSCNLEGTRGHLTWVNNWVTFTDCMLQTMLIGKDTRNLVVPTRIEKFSIDPIVHCNMLLKNDLDEGEQTFEVNVYPELEIIRAGGVEIRGCHASPITKRIPLDVPVLAKYVFVPNFSSKIMLDDAIRTNLQIVLENVQTLKVKASEFVDEEYKTHSLEPLMEKVATVFGDMPLVQTELSVISKENFDIPSPITVENKEISEDTNNLVFIGANLLQRPKIIENGAVIVTGKIYLKKDQGQDYRALPPVSENTDPNAKQLLTKDFYKELKLRGYQYSGLFRGVKSCNLEGTRGHLTWVNNWVTFTDCMLQTMLIGKDTRNLVVPTRIEKFSIDPIVHCNMLLKNDLDEGEQTFEVNVYPELEIIRAGGVEIRGCHASPITKRIPLDVPVLAKYVFVPNFSSKIMLDDAIRTNLQIVLENVQTLKVKASEFVDEEYKTHSLEPLMEKVATVFGDMPLVQTELSVISKENFDIPSPITVENKEISEDTNNLVFIGANLLQRPKVLQQARGTLRNKCFIMSRENTKPDTKRFSDEYDIISVHNTGTEYLVLFRKRVGAIPAKFVQVVSLDDSFAWIENIKQELKTGQKLVLYAQGEHLSGLIGLVNSLRREPGGELIYGVLISDISAPPFNPDLELYEQQIDKDLALNVYLNGQWGSYRHLLLGDLNTVKATHGYVSTLTVGDLSSLTWVEGRLKEEYEFKNNDSVLIHVYCSALNFHDIMTATGRMTVNVAAEGRLNQNCMQGFEVVGRLSDGSRVMAVVRENGIANLVEGDKALTWRIPDEWSFEEAATVPVAYCTVFYAMILVGQMQPGESILIHAGSGGVGQAAINVALHYGCEVFTTVGTPEKRAFIKKRFPQLKDSNIGNSRDTSFEEMIRRETKGKGVDLVLNCLADDKLQASIRCLGYRGRFLEIGNYDISNNTPIGMQFFLKETSFYGILLDYVLNQNNGIKQKLKELLLGGIQSGAVKPLTYCTFEKHEVEAAFRYMAAGKHIGKVVVKIREEEKSRKPVKPSDYPLDVVPRYICHEDNVYIIIGGLGGFGLELADWLIMRGARKLVLSSRRGISNGYQAYRVKAWRGYGVHIQISTHDVTTAKGCEEILKTAKKIGNVQTIFNLAAVLKDALIEKQTPETFKIAFAPKVKATLHLDNLSRKLFPELQDFVVFSSLASGLGNAGQTNYGMANSIMEKICEQRKKLGLPALAIQWGAVGEVGLLADMRDENLQVEIGGTIPQKIVSCLETLEKLLKQNEPVVSTMVVAEKKIGGSGNEIVDAIAQVMGIKDLKKVPQQVPLAELGMDSMMTVEIKQCLERDFEVFLTEEDIRELTFTRLIELTSERAPSSENKLNMLKGMTGLELMMKVIGKEEQAYKPYIYMPTLISDGGETEKSLSNTEKVIFMLPGIEGSATVLEPLCRRLKAKACVLQLGLENETVEQMIDRLYQVLSTLLPPGAPFTILAYSFGCRIVPELVARLEKEGRKGLVFCLEGSPEFTNKMASVVVKSLNDTELQNNLISFTLSKIAPNSQTIENLPAKLNEIESYEKRVLFASKICQVPDTYSTKFISSFANACFNRIKYVLDFDENKLAKIKAPIILMRCKNNFLNLDESYGLNKCTESTVSVHLLEGNHYSIVENKDVANMINKALLGEDSSQNL